MFYCKYCGRQLNDGALFCDKCGNRIAPQNEEAIVPKENAVVEEVLGSKENTVVEETPQKEEYILKTGVLSRIADKMGYKALVVLLGVFSIASSVFFLITGGWGFAVFLNVIAVGITVFLWARRSFENRILFAIPMLIFGTRIIIQDIFMAFTRTRFMFPVIDVLIQLIVLAVLVLYILRMSNALNRKKASPSICILLFIQMFFVLLEGFANMSSGVAVPLNSALEKELRTDRLMSFWAMLGWILFLLSQVLLELLSAVNVQKEEYSEPVVADAESRKEYISKLYSKESAKPSKPEVKIFIPESYVRENEEKKVREKEKEEQRAVEKTAVEQRAVEKTDPAEVVAKADEAAAPTVGKDSPQTGSFVDLDEVIIDEKISAFKFTNAYKIYNTTGHQVGAIEQVNQVSGGAMAAQILFGSKMKAVQAFEFNIVDNEGKRIAGLKRDGLGGGVSAVRTMSVSDADGSALGTVHVIPHAWLPSFDIRDTRGDTICSIESDWKGYVYTLKSPTGSELGMINKKWTGLAREYFTTADKYQVKLYDDLRGKNRLLIFTASVLIDIISHEI